MNKTPETLIAYLRNIPFLSDLSEEDLRALAQRMTLKTATAGTLLFQAEDTANALYVVHAGEVEIVDARGVSLAVLRPGSFTGELSLLAQRPYGVTARALTEVSLWELRREALEAVMNERPAVAMAITRALIRRARPQATPPSLSTLSQVPLFEGLAESDLADILQHLQVVQYDANAVIYEPGEPATALFIVGEGEVSIRRLESGTAVELYRARALEFFGEEEALAGENRLTAAVAVEPTTCWLLPAIELDNLVSRHPRLGMNIARLTAARLVSERPVGPATTSQFQVPALARQIPQRERREWFGWLRRLDRGTRRRLALLAVLVLWLVGVAVPWTAWRTMQQSQMYSQVNLGEWGRTIVGNSPAGVSLATELELAYPTPTYTPAPTPTPTPQ